MRRFLAEYWKRFPKVWRQYYGNWSLIWIAVALVVVLLLDWTNIWP